MDTTNPGGEHGTTEVGAILELQRMIAEELDATDDLRAFSRSFIPLTDGLGLESPKKETSPVTSVPSREPARPTKTVPVPDPFAALSVTEEIIPEPPASPPPASLASVIEARPPQVAPKESGGDGRAATTPPPVPRPSVWRRVFASFADEIFVWTLCAVAGLITLNALSGSTSYLSLHGLANLHQPGFGKYVLLEFFTLWLCYFALCLGLLDMTFGMWVWGIRVGYTIETGGGPRFWSKMVRVLLSFFFFAPVFPLVLLVIRRKGKNLIDALSGTHLYRTLT